MDLKTIPDRELILLLESTAVAYEAKIDDIDHCVALRSTMVLESITAELERRCAASAKVSFLELRLAAEMAEVEVSRAHIDEMTITFDGLKRSLPPDNGMFSIACSMHDQRRDQVDAARAANNESRKGGE